MSAGLRVTSAPSVSVAQRVSNANSMKELLELMPINVRAPLGELCEELFKGLHKAASVRTSLEELRKHQAEGTFPSAISIKAYTVQTCKEFWGSGELSAAQAALAKSAKAYTVSLLAAYISIKEKEFGHLRDLLAPTGYSDRIRSILSVAKESLLSAFEQMLMLEPGSGIASGS